MAEGEETNVTRDATRQRVGEKGYRWEEPDGRQTGRVVNAETGVALTGRINTIVNERLYECASQLPCEVRGV